MTAKKPSPIYIQNVYLVLTLLSTLAASFIWGVNTLFLLSAGLSNAEAFLANAFFTLGEVVFEVPTGIVADIKGRRLSFLLGTITLSISTLLYLWAWYLKAPLLMWAVSSILLGLGFTFFNGATEAWLVDALAFSGHKGTLESVFAKAQVVGGIAMLVGATGGGLIAQFTNLSVPYLIRAALLIATFVVAFLFMKDWGFTPMQRGTIQTNVKQLFKTSFGIAVKEPTVRWLMLSAPVISGIGFYAFYAMQPYLLHLYGDPKAYVVAGLAASIVAGSQIVGGLSVPYVRKVFKLRTEVLLLAASLSVVLLLAIGLTTSFWVAIVMLCLWGLLTSAAQPVRQAYMNGLIPSKQRATVLSFDSMLGSVGGAVVQPILGKVADLSGYSASFVVSGVIQILAVPFIFLARQEKSAADKI